MTAVSPATLQILPNEYYKSQRGLHLGPGRGDPRGIQGHRRRRLHPANRRSRAWSISTTGGSRSTATWPAIANGPPSRSRRVNHALQGIPEDRVRFHICWGSWHGPHSGDVPLKDVVDLLLKVKAQAYSVEAGNVRHEHEWKVWKDTKLPDGKILIPGVCQPRHQLLEHPELVADRIIRFAQARRPRERHCRDRLRSRRTCASADRLGEASRPFGGGEAGKQKAVDLARACVNRCG